MEIFFDCFSSASSAPPYFAVCSIKRKKERATEKFVVNNRTNKIKKNNRIQCLVVLKCITIKFGSIYCFVIIHKYHVFNQYFDILF